MLETYVIHVTKLCNLDCKYCYEKDKRSTYTWEEIKKVIDEIVKYNSKFNIEFLGGEPMLASDLIIKSYEYLESFKDINVNNYIITTNSTIIDDNFLSFLKNSKKITWAASIDGNEYANQLRVFKKQDYRDAQINSYKESEKVLLKVLNEIGSERTAVHMVTHPYNVHLMYKSVRHFYNLGIKLIGIGTIESTMEIGREYVEEFLKQIGFISESIISGEFKNISIDILQAIKPRSDNKNYIYDENNKLILETYGRVSDDLISQTKVLNVVESNGKPERTELIEDIREEAYNIHQGNLRKWNL